MLFRSGEVAGERPGDAEGEGCEEEDSREKSERIFAVSAGIFCETLWIFVFEVSVDACEYEMGVVFVE